MNRIRCCAGLLAFGLVSGAVMAQPSEPAARYDLGRPAWIPGMVNAYAGLSLGRPNYQLGCGVSACDQPPLSGRVYTGAMFSRFWGAELGVGHMGELGRVGGGVRAEGVNFSLLGRADVGAGFGVFGRVGTTYGRTRASAANGSGLTAGRASGWGPAYGLGVDWSFNEHWSAVLDWQRQRFDFAGDETGWVRATSIGLKYRF